MKRRLSAMLWLSVVLAGCGGTDGDGKDPVDEPIVINNGEENNGGATNNGAPNNGAPNNGVVLNNGEGTVVEANVKMGILAPSTARSTGIELVQLGVSAVFEASIQANGGTQLVATGTLTQSGQSFTYSATPADRLRIVWAEGPPTDLYVENLQGDFSGDANLLISRDHLVTVRAVREGFVDLEVESRQQGGQLVRTAAGSLTSEGVTYTVDLSESGTFSSEVEITYSNYDSDTSFSGTISGDNGFSQQVQERFVYKQVNDVTNDDRAIESTWSVGGDDYSLTDARIRFEQRSGRIHLSDYWIIQGTVLRNGAPIGQINYELTDVYLSIFVEVGSERIELYRFTE